MKHLFIIGNGFDCYLHKLPTEYKDFRKYILSKYPDAEEYDELVPEYTLMPDGDEVMDIEEVAGYLTRIIDDCGGNLTPDEIREGRYWKDLESYLGSRIFDTLYYDLEEVPWDGSDKQTMKAIHRNEDVATSMKQAFGYMKQLFCDWVKDGLGSIKYNSGLIPDMLKKDYIAEVLNNGDGFLNFNYTMTLEKVYGIDSSLICHIHGKVGDDYDDIFFGHGDRSEVPETINSIGADLYLGDLKRELRKDTDKALNRHRDFFAKIATNIETIHSYGFSFSDVDMPYIEEIAHRVDKNKTVWNLNKHDSSEKPDRRVKNWKSKRQKLEELGFNVRVDNRW